MTNEEREKHLDWLYRLKREIFVFMPIDWLIPFADALDVAIKALEQEPTTKNDLGVDCISREQALEPYKILKNTDTLSVYTIRQNLAELPSMGRYDPYTDKFIKE